MASRILESYPLKRLPFAIKILLTRLYAFVRLSRRPRLGFLEFSYFPFDSQQPLSPGALEVLLAVSRDLRTQGIRGFLSDGTLLGLVRDGRLIPHDNDLDFGVIGLDSSGAIRKIMKSRGFRLASLSRLGSSVYHMSFFNEHQHIVDFTVYEEVGEHYVSFRDFYNYFVIPKNLIAELAWLEIWGSKVSVPKFYEDLLHLLYGPDWKTPVRRRDRGSSYYGARRVFPDNTSVSLSLRSDIVKHLSAE